MDKPELKKLLDETMSGINFLYSSVRSCLPMEARLHDELGTAFDRFAYPFVEKLEEGGERIYLQIRNQKGNPTFYEVAHSAERNLQQLIVLAQEMFNQGKPASGEEGKESILEAFKKHCDYYLDVLAERLATDAYFLCNSDEIYSNDYRKALSHMTKSLSLFYGDEVSHWKEHAKPAVDHIATSPIMFSSYEGDFVAACTHFMPEEATEVWSRKLAQIYMKSVSDVSLNHELEIRVIKALEAIGRLNDPQILATAKPVFEEGASDHLKSMPYYDNLIRLADGDVSAAKDAVQDILELNPTSRRSSLENVELRP